MDPAFCPQFTFPAHFQDVQQLASNISTAAFCSSKHHLTSFHCTRAFLLSIRTRSANYEGWAVLGLAPLASSQWAARRETGKPTNTDDGWKGRGRGLVLSWAPTQLTLLVFVFKWSSVGLLDMDLKHLSTTTFSAFLVQIVFWKSPEG